MGRKLRTSIPIATSMLTPQWPYLEFFKKQNKEFKEKQKRNFDKSHKVQFQPQIPVDTKCGLLQKGEDSRKSCANAGTPRSYVVETLRGEIERNREHLNVDPSQADQSSTSYQQEEVARNSPKVIMTRSRYPQSNGQAERTVKTVKSMLTCSDDLHTVLLSYRTTPFPWCNLYS